MIKIIIKKGLYSWEREKYLDNAIIAMLKIGESVSLGWKIEQELRIPSSTLFRITNKIYDVETGGVIIHVEQLDSQSTRG